MNYKNNIMRSAVWDNMCDSDGNLQPEIFDVYKNLAEGGVGIISTGFARVIKEDQAIYNQMSMYSDEFIDQYALLARVIKSQGAVALVQLAVGGSQSYGDSEIYFSPSGITNEVTNKHTKEMTKDDIDYVINSFADAAVRCEKAGFDGIIIHAAHGYLISSFCSPYVNKRNDEYGKDRNLLLKEVFKRIKANVSENFIIGMKKNSEDCFSDGLQVDESLKQCIELDQLGIDFIEVSGGFGLSKEVVKAKMTPSKRAKGENYYLEFAKNLKKNVSCLVAVTGGIKDLQQISDVDIIGLARPLILEPDYVNKYLLDNSQACMCLRCGMCVGSKCMNPKFGDKVENC